MNAILIVAVWSRAFNILQIWSEEGDTLFGFYALTVLFFAYQVSVLMAALIAFGLVVSNKDSIEKFNIYQEYASLPKGGLFRQTVRDASSEEKNAALVSLFEKQANRLRKLNNKRRRNHRTANGMMRIGLIFGSLMLILSMYPLDEKHHLMPLFDALKLPKEIVEELQKRSIEAREKNGFQDKAEQENTTVKP